ncbi:hypothetical protein CHH91_07225 [Virgibacillus sp. 7505]|nr:hypothetical protein CHH91_07225 [Virgibacillus sp. 7505]
MNRFSSSLYQLFEWITRFAYLNVLWILFTIAGGFIFGFFPSTIAMFTIIRDWLKGESGSALFPSFWTYFRREFWKSNRLGVFVTGLSIIIVIDFWYMRILTTSLTWTHIPLLVFILFSLLLLFYLFPTFVHYDSGVRTIIRNAFLIMLIHPLHTLLILICLASLTMIMYVLPSLAFLFGGSSYAFITMWLSLHAFTSMRKKSTT